MEEEDDDEKDDEDDDDGVWQWGMEGGMGIYLPVALGWSRPFF